MSDISFNLEEVVEKPDRKYRKGSKYDKVLDSFLDSNAALARVDVTGRNGNYIRTQLKRRIDYLDYTGKITVSVVNSTAYLEKI